MFLYNMARRYLSGLKDVVWDDGSIWMRDFIIRYIEKRKSINRVNLKR